MQRFNAARGRQPIGLAYDGHIFWGPYKDDGTLYNGCETDLCNGVYVDGFYGYALTSFLPYTLGCFGGAANVKGISP